LLAQTAPEQAGPQSALVVHEGGTAPVHLHSSATQPQPQPHSALTVQVLVGVTHLVPSLLQVSPGAQAAPTVQLRQPPVRVQVWRPAPTQRVAPSLGQVSLQLTGWHFCATQWRPAHAGPQSASTVHEGGGSTPVHSQASATQPQPQPQSALVVQAPPLLVEVVVAEVLAVVVPAVAVLPPEPPPEPPVEPAMFAGESQAAARMSVATAARAEKEERRSDMIEPPVRA
jgi:hypothetical protein